MDPFLYQYAVGGLVFLCGLFVAWRQGYVGLQGGGLRNLAVMLLGLAAFAGLQGYLQYAPMNEAEACAYPCVEELGQRSADELNRIETIINADDDSRPVLGAPIDYAIMIMYFVAMLLIGTFFGRNQKTTKDFFFGGQRFAWWLISFSLVATTVGSYSFVKYSKIAFNFGIASSQTYLNDWFWIPLLLFGWLPILYFSRVVSIPEYFERRFGRRARQVATVLLLVYLVGYVGINLFTMGKALHHLLGWPVFAAAAGVASVSAVYVTFGGQTSVIMTDLFQGVMLLATGLVLLWLGMDYLGDPQAFWDHLPRDHRRAFVGFNDNPSYHSVGIFWQDAMANSAMFYFLNQGMVMRLMAARSVKDSRRAVISMFAILMPVAAVVVASGGWVGRALVHAGAVPDGMEADRAFYDAAYVLTQPGVFGLVMAALTAALMSTVDTLITAISAIVVNDVYKPLHPDAPDQKLLSVARISAVGITLVGVALVPVFNSFDSIYSAHGAFTAAVTPPLVITLLLGVFWRRFTPVAALVTMVGGSLAIAASIAWPELITPFAHGVPMKDVEPGLFAGKNQYKFMRAFYGLAVCFGLGVVSTLFSRPRSLDSVRGLVWGTVGDAIRGYKGSDGTESESDWSQASVMLGAELGLVGEYPSARISTLLAKTLEAGPGDLLYVSDTRRWLGGLRSTRVLIESVDDTLTEPGLALQSEALEALVAKGREEEPVRVRRQY